LTLRRVRAAAAAACCCEIDAEDCFSLAQRKNVLRLSRSRPSFPLPSPPALNIMSSAQELQQARDARASYKDKAIKRLTSEYAKLCREPIACCTAEPKSQSDFFKWKAIIEGPPDTPYAGGKFNLDITFPLDYPFKPPQVKMITKCYHPNICDTHICVDILQSKWSPALGVTQILLSLSSLLSDPNPEHGLNEEAAQLFVTNRKAYDATAQDWVQKHASGNDTSDAGTAFQTSIHPGNQAIAVEIEEMLRSRQCVSAREQSQDAQLKLADINDDELIQCSICTEEYDDSPQRLPRLLPCGHTICTCCLLSLSSLTYPDAIQCPYCMTRHLVPRPAVIDAESVARTMPINFHAKQVNVLR
jgi:ubiquitin-conjugating enzyme E2 D/E